MWVLSKIADAFDEQKDWENRYVDSTLKSWVGSTIYEDSPWYRNAGVYVAAGTLYSVNKITTTVGAGFVDILRLGDGVQEGGWGYGKDALRLLMVLGPAARAARWAVSLIPAVDTFPTVGNCTWVAAARLLRLTGARPLAQLADLAKLEGIAAAETGGAWPKDLLPIMKLLGAAARAGKPVTSMTELAKLAAQNPQAAILFSVEWLREGRLVGHTLIAVRGLYGGLKIIDRTGAVVKSLVELGKLFPGYGPIGSAVMTGTTVIVENSMVVRSLGLIPSLANVISHAVEHPPESFGVHEAIPLDHVSVNLGGANHHLSTMNQGHASASHSAGGVHHHRSHNAELSPIAVKIYRALGTGETPVTYRQIMERTHLHIDDVLRGVQELVDKRKAALVPLSKG